MPGFPYGLHPDGTVTVSLAGVAFVGEYRRLRGRPLFDRDSPVRTGPARVIVWHRDLGSRESPVCRCDTDRHICSSRETARSLLQTMVEAHLRDTGNLPPPPAWGRCW